MGVRFECPQGHKLHVKAHLAGQRGICPQCGVRFVVPSFSGGRVASVAAGEAAGPEGDVTASMESTVSFNAGLSQSLPPAPVIESPTSKPVDAIYAARRRRRQINARLTFVLGTLSVILLAVLLFVLTR